MAPYHSFVQIFKSDRLLVSFSILIKTKTFTYVLRSHSGIWQPSPILLACHRARWLSAGFLLHEEGGLRLFTPLFVFIFSLVWNVAPMLILCVCTYNFPSLAVAHLDALAAMTNEGAMQLAGAIAYGLWEGIMLPEGVKGLAGVLHDWVYSRENEKTNNNAALKLIKMVRSSKMMRCSTLDYTHTPSEAL